MGLQNCRGCRTGSQSTTLARPPGESARVAQPEIMRRMDAEDFDHVMEWILDHDGDLIALLLDV
jgi:hypothetical protein